ncbi:MAG TPA: hypothetical protein V6C52_05125 [Coleofasciculaceae cyanobacterium]|jgi:hypothetical protein
MATFAPNSMMTFTNPFLNGSSGRNPLAAINVLNTWRFGGAASTVELQGNAFNQGIGVGASPFGQTGVPPMNGGFTGFMPQTQGFPTGAFDAGFMNPGFAWNAGFFNNGGIDTGFLNAGFSPFTQFPSVSQPSFGPMGFFV